MGVCWFLYQGVTQRYYIYLIIRFGLKQEKTRVGKYLVIRQRFGAFGFLFGCIPVSVTIRLSQTFFLKAWNTVREDQEREHRIFKKHWDAGRENK